MLLKLLVVFVTVPLIELYLLLWLANITSIATTVLIVIATAIVGSWLARQQGWMAIWRFRRAATEGRLPTDEIVDGLLIVFAAALLLTPGLLTDAFGLALLIPTSRKRIRRFLLRRVSQRIRVQTAVFTDRANGNSDFDHGGTIDAQFRHAPQALAPGDTDEAVTDGLGDQRATPESPSPGQPRPPSDKLD